MTVPIMRSTLALLAALVLAPACGDAGALDAGARKELETARDAAEQAQADAEVAATRITSLQEQVAELTQELPELRKGRRKLADRLSKVGAGLRKSLQRLRTAFDDVQAGAASAGAEADEALARAAQIARELAVLEQRYDYHLRRYHGGG